MKRLTERTPEGGYVLSDGVDISVSLKKLALFEDMYDSLRDELQKITDDIDRIKVLGKTNSVTHRQLLANKLMCMNLLGRFETYLSGL